LGISHNLVVSIELLWGLEGGSVISTLTFFYSDQGMTWAILREVLAQIICPITNS
jgi:hypothetical protein